MDGWISVILRVFVVNQMYGWIEGWMDSVSLRYRKDGWMDGLV